LENSTSRFFASTVARTALGGGFYTSFIDRNQNNEKHQTLVLGQIGWIGCVHFKKLNVKFFLYNRGQNGPRGRVLHEFCRPKPKLQKHTKHEFWVKQSGFGALFSKDSMSSFFASTVARTALGGGFCTIVDRSRNCENAPNMSLGSNGVDCVRSF
jgi:hypothetical protein